MKRLSSKNYDKWKKTATEMGFTEVEVKIAYHREDKIVGNYRNHNVTIEEIGGGDGHAPETRYEVEFKNAQMILIYIKKKFFPPYGYVVGSLRRKCLKRIQIDDARIEGLVVEANKEAEIKAILDSSIQDKLMTMKDTLHEMEIGHVDDIQFLNQPFIKPNIAVYIDRRPLTKTKEV